MSSGPAGGSPPRSAAVAIRRTRFGRLALFGVLVAVSLVVLFTPASDTPQLMPGLDKVVHLGLFAALALSGRWAGFPSVPLAIGLVAYAGASEVLQGVLPVGRSGDPVDALVDVVGIVLGLVAGRWLAAPLWHAR